MKHRTLRSAIALAAALTLAALPAAARADHGQESIFQDDDHLVYASTATVGHVLGVLQALGIDRLRITIKWSAIAPDPMSRTRPAHFDATNPSAYPRGAWAPYDRVLEMAQARGIGVDFNVTAPGPLWAMKHGAPQDKEADHYAPSVPEWAQFVYAVGLRYSGSYVPSDPAAAGASPSGGGLPVPLPVPVPPVPGVNLPPAHASPSGAPAPGGPGRAPDPRIPHHAADARIPHHAADASAQALPRVHYWTIWNEPNIDGWLSPQWRSASGRLIPNSPRLYREYLDAAFGALYQSGHTLQRDTILIGETAPEGYPRPTSYPEMEPMPFLRALYCVNGSYRALRGSAATQLGCPASGSRKAFVQAHPGLFYATGYAHHPYYFFFPPSYISDNTGFVPIANLSRLEGGLDRVFRLYGVRRRIPIYLTEYGYQTYPDPLFGAVVSLQQQAAYLNQADYMAYQDPRVRSVAQFLLYDSGPPYATTFQTGLLFESGRAKPAFPAYRLPIWVSGSSFRRRARVPIWGQVRPAVDGTAQAVLIQWRSRRGHFRTVATVTVPASSPEGYFTTSIRAPGTGYLRFAWRYPGGALIASRNVAIRVR